MKRWVWFGMMVLAGCNRDMGPGDGAGFQPLPSDQVIVGFEQHVSESGQQKAILKGDTAFIYEDSSLAKVRDVNLVMYNEAGQVSARLTSEAGRLNTFTQQMTATGNVVLITEQDGRRIETEELHYDPNTHRVWSNVRTVQRHQGATLTGTGFEADDKFNNVRVLNARTSGGGLRITF